MYLRRNYSHLLQCIHVAGMSLFSENRRGMRTGQEAPEEGKEEKSGGDRWC